MYKKDLILYLSIKRMKAISRPISLLPIFGQIFEKIIYSRIYNFLLDENLYQPGFCLSDACVNQLLAITHEIFEVFDCNLPLEVRSVLLDISKAFDKVWHKDCFLSSNLLTFQEKLINFLKITYEVDFKGSF